MPFGRRPKPRHRLSDSGDDMAAPILHVGQSRFSDAREKPLSLAEGFAAPDVFAAPDCSQIGNVL